MEVLITAKEIVQIAIFIIASTGAIWKVSNVLNDIKTELKLMSASLLSINPQLVDHENRIRSLEKSSSKCEQNKE